jgi:AAA domain
MTFIEIRDKLFEELPSKLKDVEAYLVSTVFVRFNLFIVTENEELKSLLSNEYASYFESIQSVKNGDFIYIKLQEGKVKISENFFFIDRHVDKMNWFINNKRLKFKSKVISFYSFKGGLGRTTALVLSALHLARKGKKVVLIDFDLEAPGLASLFINQEDSKFQDFNVKGVTDFMLDLSVNQYQVDKININDYYFLLNKQDLVGQNGGELLIFPATDTSTDGYQRMNYIDKLSKINLQYASQSNYAPDELLKLIDAQLKPDFVFIDTRTGVNDIGGLVFQRYADINFLFFYGNQQNMFGLESVLEKLSQIKTNFYLVNSPVPIDSETDEMDYFLERSYDIFSTLYYGEDQIPDIKDSTAPHYPLIVPYNETASFLNNTNKLKILLEEKGTENPYLKITNLILAEDSGNNDIQNLDVNLDKELIDAMSRIINELAASEDELATMDDLKNNFYPRRDYKFIFDRNRFLVLGEKGSGKTALYAVLTHELYAKSLAKFCDINNDEIPSTNWIKGLDTTEYFPTELNFKTLKVLTDSQLRNYWLYLLLRVMPVNPDFNKDIEEQLKSLKDIDISELREWAKDDLKAEKFEKILREINNVLKKENKFLIFVYDYIDKQLSSEDNLRGRLVEALLKLWYGYINSFSNMRSKIFLRRDIYEREIGQNFTDKSKLNNYTQEIEWDNTQLLNMVWKRVIQQNPDATTTFFRQVLTDISIPYDEVLGYVPNFNEEQHRMILENLLGKRMGANNKAFPYNWVVQHMADTNQHIHPRSILNLFGLAAQKQKLDTTETSTPLKPFIMETVLGKVSENRVRDLIEEYPHLASIFSDLKKHTSELPILDKGLNTALSKIIKDKNLNLKPNDIIETLINIGVLYIYNYKKTDSQIRYHIPDLYLWGLGLRRRGPGAHKDLIKRNNSMK